MTDIDNGDTQAPTPGQFDIPTGAKSVRKQVSSFRMNGQIKRAAEKANALATMTRQECFDQGYLTVKDLDDEELVAGKCRNEYGVIPKKKGTTEVVPVERYEEMVAEHEIRFKTRLRQNLDKAIDVMVGIMDDDSVEPRERFEAAKYIFERTAGKTPETVNVNVKSAPWEDLLSSVTGIAPMKRSDHHAMTAQNGEDIGIVDVEWTEQVEDAENASNDMVRDDREPQSDTPDEQEMGAAADLGPVQEDRPGNVEATESDALEEDDEEPLDLVTNHDNENIYGRRADEKRSYAQQTRDAANLALRRKQARDKRNDAKKQRKIKRALGADAIKDEITGVNLSDDGQLNFE